MDSLSVLFEVPTEEEEAAAGEDKSKADAKWGGAFVNLGLPKEVWIPEPVEPGVRLTVTESARAHSYFLS